MARGTVTRWRRRRVTDNICYTWSAIAALPSPPTTLIWIKEKIGSRCTVVEYSGTDSNAFRIYGLGGESSSIPSSIKGSMVEPLSCSCALEPVQRPAPWCIRRAVLKKDSFVTPT